MSIVAAIHRQPGPDLGRLLPDPAGRSSSYFPPAGQLHQCRALRPDLPDHCQHVPRLGCIYTVLQFRAAPPRRPPTASRSPDDGHSTTIALLPRRSPSLALAGLAGGPGVRAFLLATRPSSPPNLGKVAGAAGPVAIAAFMLVIMIRGRAGRDEIFARSTTTASPSPS